MKAKNLLSLLAICQEGKKMLTELFQKVVAIFNSDSQFNGVKEVYTPTEEDGIVDYKHNREVMPASKGADVLGKFINKTVSIYENLLSIDKTNSSSRTIELVVDDKSFGKFTVLELMRLKSELTRNEFVKVIDNMPIEPNRNWSVVDNGIKYSTTSTYKDKTTVRKPIIVKDPNVNPDNLPAHYTGNVQYIDEEVIIGSYTQVYMTSAFDAQYVQKVSENYKKLIIAITNAITELNNTETIKTEGDVDKVFGFIFCC